MSRLETPLGHNDTARDDFFCFSEDDDDAKKFHSPFNSPYSPYSDDIEPYGLAATSPTQISNARRLPTLPVPCQSYPFPEEVGLPQITSETKHAPSEIDRQVTYNAAPPSSNSRQLEPLQPGQTAFDSAERVTPKTFWPGPGKTPVPRDIALRLAYLTCPGFLDRDKKVFNAVVNTLTTHFECDPVGFDREVKQLEPVLKALYGVSPGLKLACAAATISAVQTLERPGAAPQRNKRKQTTTPGRIGNPKLPKEVPNRPPHTPPPPTPDRSGESKRGVSGSKTTTKISIEVVESIQTTISCSSNKDQTNSQAIATIKAQLRSRMCNTVTTNSSVEQRSDPTQFLQ